MANALTPIALALLFLAVQCYPKNEEDNQNIELNVSIEDDLNTRNVEEIKKTLDDVAYIQNFKSMMADYVKTENINLTEHEMDTVKDYLEEFCHQFARDLQSIIDNGTVFKETIDDGLPDSTFENVKNNIKAHLPGTNDSTLDHVAYVLRKNLFFTRQKIDKVVNGSKVAAIVNSF